MRDDFTKQTIETLADRAGNRCSNPGCRQPTSGPRTESTRAVNIGVAAHITAASEGGPRYDSSLTPEERRHPDNGIWLCQNCAKLVDNDPARYPVDLLRAWKRDAEDAARREIEQRPAAGETHGEDSATVVHTGSGSLAQGGSVAAGEGGVAVKGDVHGGIRLVQIGGSIQAGSIQARNVVSGTQIVGAPSGATVEDLRRQVAALQEQLVAAIAAGAVPDLGDAEEAQGALDVVGAELDKSEPRGRLVMRNLAQVTEVLSGAAEVPETMAGIGTEVIKLATVANTLWQLASKLFGG